MLRFCCALLLCALSSVPGARAAKNLAGTTLVYACRQAAAPVTVDGDLGDAEWAGAAEVGGFRITKSEALAPEQVTMRLLYDRDCLYLGVKCFESRMKSLKANVKQRDGAFWEDDAIEIFFDPAHDHEHYFQLAVTAGGTCYDNRQGESLWNGDWRAAARQNADSWAIEAAIPFRTLNLPAPAPGTLWGFNLCRERQAGGHLELFNWADVKRVFQNPPYFGHLYFAGPGWQAGSETSAAALKDAGGSQARLFVEGGFWRARTGQAPEWLPYQALLRTHARAAVGRMAELRALYRDRPNLKHRAEFEALDTRCAEVEALSQSDQPVDVTTWSQATSFLDGLQEKVEDVYWRVRLAVLDESL